MPAPSASTSPIRRVRGANSRRGAAAAASAAARSPSQFKGASANLQSGYRTPLGTVPVDQNLAKKIIDISPQIRWVPRAHAREHSLEIQLPFLQTVLSDFQIVPIVMGQQDFNTCSDLAASLVKVLGSMEKTLILASSDLSHFHNYNQAKRLDMEFTAYTNAYPANHSQGIGSSLTRPMTASCASTEWTCFTTR